MANKTITMLQIRRILQLLNSGMSARKIAWQLNLSRNTTNGYVQKTKETGLSYNDLLSLSDEELHQTLCNSTTPVRKDERYTVLEPKFIHYEKELKRTGVTRLLLWEEYRKEHPEGYSYSQFCEYLSQYQLQNKVVMHLDHKPGEVLQIDFAGSMLSYVDRKTGQVYECPVLICSLPYSSYVYVEVLASQKLEELVKGLNNCLQYLGGVPVTVKGDNMKQWVIMADRYEPSFNELAQQWSVHYNTSLSAARVKKPRDKATVEKSVDVAYKQIYAPLRDEIFYSLDELNQAVWDRMDKLNNRQMQNRTYSRYERFIREEKNLLMPLPDTPFIFKHVTEGKVQRNYHVILGENWNQYSVPHQHVGKRVRLIYDASHVEIYLGLQRVALHQRSFVRNQYITNPDHLPEKHRRYQASRGWDEEYFMKQANKIGPNTVDAFKHVLSSRQFTEQSFNSCIGIIRLTKRYGKDRMEKACGMCLEAGAVTYKLIGNILKNNRDKQEDQISMDFTLPRHDNIRGPEAYN